MEQSILNFNKQFDYEPEIINAEKIGDFDHVILCGMGGSHLPADLIKTIKPGVEIYVHKDYDLPPYDKDFLKSGLLIASSYSGNTEEVISFYEKAQENEYKVAVISTGGKLIEMAQADEMPYVEIPDTGIQPRLALGYSMIALLEIMGDQEMIEELRLLNDLLNPESLRLKGEKIAKDINGKVRVVYSSNPNMHIAYNWKIKLNETGKAPAYYNFFPELNHNEMQGFDFEGDTEHFKDKFHVIFLHDKNDNIRIQERMKITEEIYKEKGIDTTNLELEGKTRAERVFNALILADWISFYLAEMHGIDPESVPMIEDFKKRLML